MNIQTIIGIVIAVVVIGGGIWYFSTHGTPQPYSANQNQQRAATTQLVSGTGTIASLIGQAGSWSCDITVNNPNAPAHGTTYISNGQIRADVSAQVASAGNMNITAHMIQAGGYIYSWTDLVPQGFKMPVSSATSAGAQSQGISTNTQVSYTCNPWVADESKFVPPTNITFKTMTTTGARVPSTGGY